MYLDPCSEDIVAGNLEVDVTPMTIVLTTLPLACLPDNPNSGYGAICSDNVEQDDLDTICRDVGSSYNLYELMGKLLCPKKCIP